MSPITVAVVGGTGTLGLPLVKTLLSNQYRPEKVGRVILFTRDATSAKVKELTDLGAEAVQTQGEVPSVDALRSNNVDVLISCSGFMTSAETKVATAQAAVDAGVKVYFPSDYGFDIRLSKVKHPYFDMRFGSVEQARKIAEGRMKVILVSPGNFMESWLTPIMGVDIANGVVEAGGDPTVRRSGTSVQNIGQAVVQLAVLAANDPSSIPDDIRICGDSKSHEEVADLITSLTGKPIKVVGADWDALKAELESQGATMENVFGYVRLVYAEGSVDYSRNNHNELVNPGESVFKWKTLLDQAKEVTGTA